jgi:hypothetical protein
VHKSLGRKREEPQLIAKRGKDSNTVALSPSPKKLPRLWEWPNILAQIQKGHSRK